MAYTKASYKKRAQQSIAIRKKNAKKKIRQAEVEANKTKRQAERTAQKKINKELEKIETIDHVGKTVLDRVKSNVVDKDTELAGTALNNILNDDSDIVFKPNDGPQTQFLAASEFQVLYGGAAGGRFKS